MKIPKSFEGHMVSMHLGRPLYTFDYGAHVKVGGQESFMLVPAMKEVTDAEGKKRAAPDMTEVIIGATIVEVTDDSVVFMLFVPDPDHKGGIVVRQVIPSALILNIIELFEYDAALPQMVRRQRAAAPEKPAPKIIL